MEGEQYEPVLHKVTAVFITVYPILNVFIILTNLSVVISCGFILMKGQQHKSTYAFLGNISMADLIIGLAAAFSYLYQTADYTFFIVEKCLIQGCLLTSTYSIGLIGLDRFLYIVYGMQYPQWVYLTRSTLLICISWIIGLIIGFLPLMGWNDEKYALLIIVIGAIPLIGSIFLHLIILYKATSTMNHLKKSQQYNNGNIQENTSSAKLRMFRGQSEQQQGKNRVLTNAPKKWKALKVVLFTTGGFIITWFPFMVAYVIYLCSCYSHNTSRQCDILKLPIPHLSILRFSNCLLNPLIYAWWHKGFRKHVKEQVMRIIPKRNEVKHRSNSASNSKTTSGKNTSVPTANAGGEEV